MIRRITQFGVIALLSTAGLFAAATAASAHANSVTGIVTCTSSPGNAHYNIVWTISNNYDLSEIATVTGATGGPTTVIGFGGIQPPFVSISASPNQSDESTETFTQTLPWTASGTSAYLTVGGVW